MSKLRTLVAGYLKNRKKNKESIRNEIESLFDIIKKEEPCVCHEDKELYKVQV